MIALQEIDFAEHFLPVKVRREVLECSHWIFVILSHVVQAAVIATDSPATARLGDGARARTGTGFGGHHEGRSPFRFSPLGHSEFDEFFHFRFCDGKFVRGQSSRSRLDWMSIRWNMMPHSMFGVRDFEGGSEDFGVGI